MYIALGLRSGPSRKSGLEASLREIWDQKKGPEWGPVPGFSVRTWTVHKR